MPRTPPSTSVEIIPDPVARRSAFLANPVHSERAYTPDIARQILEHLVDGKSLRWICDQKGMPKRIFVMDWVLRNYNNFGVQYARARVLGLEAKADEIIEIADDCGLTVEEIAKAKLQVDARKWSYAKIASSLRLDSPLDPEDDLEAAEAPEIEAVARKILFVMNKSIAKKKD